MAGKFEILVSASLSGAAKTKIQEQLNKISSGLNLNIKSGSVSGLNKSLSELQQKFGEASNSGNNLTKTIENFSNWKITQATISALKEGMSSVVEEVKNLDSSLVEFQKVTDLTDTEMDNFINNSYKTAEAVARTRTRGN